jgi:hypothetical protein
MIVSEDFRVYVLRSLHGIPEIERLLEAAQSRPNPNWCDEREEAQRLADIASKRLFGITEAETRPQQSLYQSREHNDENWAAIEPYTRRGPYAEGTGPDVIEGFAEYDWDVTTEAGGVLRCLPMFARQIVLTTEGIMGRLPDEELSPDEEAGIEAKLRADAAKFNSSGRER